MGKKHKETAAERIGRLSDEYAQRQKEKESEIYGHDTMDELDMAIASAAYAEGYRDCFDYCVETFTEKASKWMERNIKTTPEENLEKIESEHFVITEGNLKFLIGKFRAYMQKLNQRF